MHTLGVDTTEVDKEMDALRESLSRATGIGPIPKLSARVALEPKNRIGLPVAMAEDFWHDVWLDDSRGVNGNLWFPLWTPFGTQYWSNMAINMAEVIYNEALSETATAKTEVAWAIRNRATQAMAPCGKYVGAEGGYYTSTCRAATPIGPQPQYASTNQAYSCVIHGATTHVGDHHSQMKDNHQDPYTMWLYGYLDLAFNVVNGLVSDPNPQDPFTAWQVQEQIWVQDPWDPTIWYPQYIWVNNIWSGNPRGAQEWLNHNYCATPEPGQQNCKKPIGNVGGDFAYTYPGSGVCPGTPSPSDIGDNFFWARGSGN